MLSYFKRIFMLFLFFNIISNASVSRANIIYFLILILPLLGFLLRNLFSQFLVCYIATTFVFFSFLLSLYLFFCIVSNPIFYIEIGSIIWDDPDDKIKVINRFFQILTPLALIFITGISTIAHVDSTKKFIKFYHEYTTNIVPSMSLSTFFMLLYVILTQIT